MRKSEKKGPNSKRARCPIFNFFVVTREVICQKMAPILDPVNFFWVLSLISHCGSCQLFAFIFGNVIGRALLTGFKVNENLFVDVTTCHFRRRLVKSVV